MPIYEYICPICKKRIDIFMRISSFNINPSCPLCGQSDMKRIFSSFAVHKSVQSIYEESDTAGSAISNDYYEDPRNIGRHLEKKFEELNVEIPSEIQNNIEAARGGMIPDSLKDLNSASPDSAYH